MRYIPTSAEVIACICIKHDKDLRVFSSFSAPECGVMETQYAFAFQEIPLFGIKTNWDIGDSSWKRENEKTEYWLCVAEKEED